MDKKISPEKLKQVEELRDWINKQPHLPKDLGKQIYITILSIYVET